MLRKVLSTDPGNYVATVLRLVFGIVFFAHGSQKMLGWFGGYGFSGTMGFFTHGMGIPAPFAFLAICAEFFGGLGLIFGLLGRVAAFGIACNMIVAIAMIHHKFGIFANWSGQQKGEGFEFHLLALAIGFSIMVMGSGAFSADAALSRADKQHLIGAGKGA
jgi:putative oxidoreductase